MWSSSGPPPPPYVINRLGNWLLATYFRVCVVLKRRAFVMPLCAGDVLRAVSWTGVSSACTCKSIALIAGAGLWDDPPENGVYCHPYTHRVEKMQVSTTCACYVVVCSWFSSLKAEPWTNNHENEFQALERVTLNPQLVPAAACIHYHKHHDRLHRSRYSQKSETSGTATKLLWTL
jgi:hypothetical protein